MPSLHRRIGLQQNIADWADTDVDRLNITATYNVVHGSPATFVKNNLGYFVTTKDLISHEPYNDVVFRPLKPELKIEYNLVWKRKNIFNNAAKVFLEEIKKSVKNNYFIFLYA